jgi:hypothetical protein
MTKGTLLLHLKDIKGMVLMKSIYLLNMICHVIFTELSFLLRGLWNCSPFKTWVSQCTANAHSWFIYIFMVYSTMMSAAQNIRYQRQVNQRKTILKRCGRRQSWLNLRYSVGNVRKDWATSRIRMKLETKTLYCTWSLTPVFLFCHCSLTQNVISLSLVLVFAIMYQGEEFHTGRIWLTG